LCRSLLFTMRPPRARGVRLGQSPAAGRRPRPGAHGSRGEIREGRRRGRLTSFVASWPTFCVCRRNARWATTTPWCFTSCVQIPSRPLRAHFVRSTVKVRQYYDGSHAIFHGPRCIGAAAQQRKRRHIAFWEKRFLRSVTNQGRLMCRQSDCRRIPRRLSAPHPGVDTLLWRRIEFQPHGRDIRMRQR
jgi:hypothetical protein